MYPVHNISLDSRLEMEIEVKKKKKRENSGGDKEKRREKRHTILIYGHLLEGVHGGWTWSHGKTALSWQKWVHQGASGMWRENDTQTCALGTAWFFPAAPKIACESFAFQRVCASTIGLSQGRAGCVNAMTCALQINALVQMITIVLGFNSADCEKLTTP